MANPTTGIRLKDDTKTRLETLGKARDRSTSYLMNEAIEKFLDVEEALEAERQLVKSRWEKFELTGETIAHEDIKSWASGLGNKAASEAI